MLPSHTAEYVKSVRCIAVESGRNPASLKFFAGITIFLGTTKEEAQAKHDAALENVDVIAGLAKFSGYTGVDMSRFPLDEPFDLSSKDTARAVHGVIANMKAGDPNDLTPWTPRKLGQKMAFGGMYPMAVGTPQQVADFMDDWVARTDIDGSSYLFL